MLSFSSIIKNNLPIGPANIKKRNVNEILNNYSNETDSCSIIDKILNFEINYNIIEKNVYRDLEIFEGLENKDDSIFNIIPDWVYWSILLIIIISIIFSFI